ncbi:MAG TPA: hypothetical protein VNN73_14600 [Blastocatellia bacterium]|nr:hypothetical protein [Blastocatellia bacterium]
MSGRAIIKDDTSRIKYELELFLLSGESQLYEDGRLIASIAAANCAAEISFGKLILSAWGDGWSRSWRVVSCEVAPEALLLQCTKQMGRTECRVELRRGQLDDKAAQSRAEFAEKIAAMIESSFAHLKVERAVTARDDLRHFSGVHTRLVIKERNQSIAAVAVSERESQSDIDAALAAGIIWLDALRRKNQSINRLMIFAPRERATTIATRLTAVQVRGASVSLYEVNEAERSIEPVAPFDQGDLDDRMRRAARRAEWPRKRAFSPEIAALVDSVVGLAPDLIETSSRAGRIAFSIRGLQFARASINRKLIEFGLSEPKQKLDDANQLELASLVAEIITSRQPDSESRNDLIFRAQAEAWLESIIRRDITAIDPALDPRFVYSQVPAYRGNKRSFIDLLAATRAGQLVVIELKVAEDAEFPFQGLDYWLRVEWHRARGDFERRGYFKGLKIADAAPLVYLVAPLFRFHATTKLVAGSIAARAPVYRIGINEDWRSRVRVLLNERLNPEE